MQKLKGILSIVLFLGIFIASAFWYNFYMGQPTIPTLEGKYWGGYYNTNLFGKVWCVGKFYKKKDQLKLVIVTAGGVADYYDVNRSSSDRDFVKLTFNSSDSNIKSKIKAKQLYLGKRYFWGRLMVGRFHDFWKKNNDVAIRGNIVTLKDNPKFEIEPISEIEVINFYNNLNEETVIKDINELNEFFDSLIYKDEKII